MPRPMSRRCDRSEIHPSYAPLHPDQQSPVDFLDAWALYCGDDAPDQDEDSVYLVLHEGRCRMTTAYDYDRQCWVTGPEAVPLLRQQLLQERALLVERGDEYLAYALPGEDRTVAEVLAIIDGQLATIGVPLRSLPHGVKFTFLDRDTVYTSRGNGFYQRCPYDGGPWHDGDKLVVVQGGAA